MRFLQFLFHEAPNAPGIEQHPPAVGDDIHPAVRELIHSTGRSSSVQDAVSKYLVQDYSPFQLAMMRFFGLRAVLADPGDAARTAQPGIPLEIAEVTADPARRAAGGRTSGSSPPRSMMYRWPSLQAITLVYPLMVTLAAIPILGEKVGLFSGSRQW